MTVDELIAKLSELEPDLEVYMLDEEEQYGALNEVMVVDDIVVLS